MHELLDGTLGGALAARRSGQISAYELTEAALARIGRYDAQIKAFLHVEAEAALATARKVDAAVARGPGPALSGIPVGRKDNFQRAGERATWGSRVFEDRTADETAVSLSRLDAAGAVDLGGLNLSEFALHIFGANALTGPPANPWDRARIAGGSSGGSAAALAAGFVFGALGSDSGGSIRNPSSLCGVVGLVPTRGLLDRRGMLVSSPSLDVPGPMARTVLDCARLFAVLSKSDDVTMEAVERYVAGVASPPDQTRILASGDLANISPGIIRAYEDAIRTLEDTGHRIVGGTLPPLEPLNDAAITILHHEAYETHAKLLQGHGALVHPEVRDRLTAGARISEEAYARALAEGANAAREFYARAFDAADLLLLPAAPNIAPKFDDIEIPAEPTAPAMDAGHYTRFVNLAGLPSLTIPAAMSGDGLPIGIQLVGRPFSESLLFGIGHQFELARGVLGPPPLDA